MTLEEIKTAVRAGKRVYWKHAGYEVKEGKAGFCIVAFNGYTIGLTWTDGVTMNGEPEDFFIGGADARA